MLDVASPRHGVVSVAKLGDLSRKNVTDNGLEFLFTAAPGSMFCRRGRPMVQVVFECPSDDDNGGNDAISTDLAPINLGDVEDDDQDWRVETHESWADRCFTRFNVITKRACATK